MKWPRFSMEWKIRSVDLSGMSLPARVALWLGLFVLLEGFLTNTTAWMIIGGVMVVAGTALWWVFGERPTWLERWLPRNRSSKKRPTRPTPAASLDPHDVQQQLHKSKQALEALRHASAVHRKSMKSSKPSSRP